MNSSMQLCGDDDAPSPDARATRSETTSGRDSGSDDPSLASVPDAESAVASGDGTEIERLRAEVERLRDQNEQLEAARQELLEQNRQLRQEATVVRLYKDVARTREEKKGRANGALSTAAEALYRTLPRSLKVREFFQYADDQGLDTQATRECFVYFLKENMLDQSGARLEKTGRILRSVTQSQDASLDDRPCTPSYGA